MEAADLHKAHVIEFCRGISPSEVPLIVKSRPHSQSEADECFGVVDASVSAYGGRRITGWSIWEKPGVFIEAEFHAVWEDADGELVDLNLRPYAFESILFLPDKAKMYQGKQVDNVRKALVQDRDVSRFLFLATRLFEIMNRGSRAYAHGQIGLSGKEAKEYESAAKEMAKLQKRMNSRYGA